MSWTQTLPAVATILTLCIASFVAAVTYQAYRIQKDPNVVLYIKIDRKLPQMIVLVLENNGRGLAKDVRFSTSGELPAHGFSMAREADDTHHPTRFLKRGVSSLGPGTKREYLWGDFAKLHAQLGDRVVKVDISYRSDVDRLFGAETYERSCDIELDSLLGYLYAHSRPKTEIKGLDKINREMTRMSNALEAMAAPREADVK